MPIYTSSSTSPKLSLAQIVKVQFGPNVVFTISDTDHLHPLFRPHHRTTGPPEGILKRIRTVSEGSSRLYAYPRPRAQNIYKPWSEVHHRRGSDAEKPLKRSDENVEEVVEPGSPSPTPPSLQLGQTLEWGTPLIIPPSPVINAQNKRTDSVDLKVLQPLLSTNRVSPQEIASPTTPVTPTRKHRRTRSIYTYPNSDAFNLQSLANALDYHLHVDLATTRPLFWSLFDVPSSRSVSPCVDGKAHSTAATNVELDIRACPGASSLVVHTHPFFPSVTLPGSATIGEVLYGLWKSLHVRLDAHSHTTNKAARVKRLMHSPVKKGDDAEGELRVDMLDGFVLFRGLEVVNCVNEQEGGGKRVECQLHLARERSWEEGKWLAVPSV